ncbi:MAG: Rpn family recombination-promoting nuclease/putative transposase [Frisingicoccus sp.]|uniref:Rpn family recombination-promoting nuclease/putative transposase n=1 Tax=Frisingicoccus sp. TaxID=1918627 RepID=UPI002614DF2F|nr:Rpn family recombination-promoting nuclease/putative transposase [Frisingicoccus sp.]MDD6233117.1 Rpn family recombination-promoting nuclease/putative transposase [Frisingicoccus sp.]
MKKNKEKRVRKPLKDLTLLDRFLFDTAMSVPEICHNILSIILDDPHLPKIHYSITEKSQEPFYDSRAVRLDLLAFDENDVVYDAEAQKKNTGRRNLKRRSRLYQSHIDVNLMEPGDLNFGRMNDVYIIFIAPFDLFGEKKYMYTFRMTCDEVPGMALNDGAVRIFLNTHGENDDEVSEELVEFLHFVEETPDDDKEIKNERVRELADQIDHLKSSQEVGVRYMRLWEEMEELKQEAIAEGKELGIEMGREEGRAEGRAQGCAESHAKDIERLIKNTGWSIEKAMDILEIPVDERSLYIEMIGHMD